MLDTVTTNWQHPQDHGTATCKQAVDVQREMSSGRLTNRQRAILRLLSEGMINKQIAYELDISVATVKTHIASAVRRMNARNRLHAVAMFVRSE